MKQGIKYLGGALLALALFWVVLRNVDPAATLAALREASPWGLLLAAVLLLGHNVFRVWRWGLLLRPVRASIPFRPRLSAVIIGYLTTWTIPGRLGEFVRPVLLSAKERIPLGPCIGSIVADRLLDGVAIVILFAVGTWRTPLSGAASGHALRVRQVAVWLLVFLIAALVGLVAAGGVRGRIAGWSTGASRLRRGVGHTVLSLLDGAAALRRPALVAPILAHSVLAWFLIALGTWVGIRACGAEVSLGAVFMLLPPLALGVALPTPGGAGGYHAAMAFGLELLFGVSGPVAVSAGILMHLVVTVPILCLGLVFLRLDGVSWRSLRTMVRGAAGGDAAAGAPPPVEVVEAAS
jgi:hypothetical protein